jgi:hypothetical protein
MGLVFFETQRIASVTFVTFDSGEEVRVFGQVLFLKEERLLPLVLEDLWRGMA